jgi:hypothetical protein
MNFNPEQAPSVPVNLDRNLPFESGVEYNPEYYYRMIGEQGYHDFVERGVIAPKPNSKQEYEKAYYFKGHPLVRYAENGSATQYFVEVDPGDEKLFEVSAPGQYPHSTVEISNNNKIRIYRTEEGQSTVVFDTM